jgi:hypothetical protein
VMATTDGVEKAFLCFMVYFSRVENGYPTKFSCSGGSRTG